ncbi:hypothetical protein FisN_6Lh079 [Fistulifera solaris]|uniref:Uncharacterized protein n=1 Tax=Fistulifera solaris TaxID=1519565 RepID=A0A1Z5K580_FISSO|nr:hypothetical protein FisN_6Lh079 [Fistulifera solaris]|eukprot:GAX21355.1 hypothetical protein FisN_6Lh079 [Fistulifera solaris]
MKILLRKLMYLTLATAVQAWVTRSRPSSRFLSLARHAKTVNEDETPTTPQIVQRTFYRFSPGSEVDVHNSVVLEDRWMIQSNDPTHRTLLLRDGNVQEGEIGEAFFTISPTTALTTSEMVMALYLASNPALCTEDLLEVSSETGLATILGILGAGFVSQQRDEENPTSAKEEEDDILTIATKRNKLVPKSLETVTLTAAEERYLPVLMKHSQQAGIPSCSVEPLDWKVRHARSRPPKEVTTIVAVDLALTYPEAVALARTCAYRLRPSWVGRESSSSAKTIPRFVHVCPADREDVVYLQRELTNGYKMTAYTSYLKLEQIIFYPQTVSSSMDEVEDMELEVQDIRSLTFTSLIAQHHPDYVGGGSGELFFPADTGATGFREAESSW